MNHTNNFQDLTENEQMEVNGGLAPLAIFGLGLLGTAAAATVDYGVQKVTGKNIAQHAIGAAKKIFK